jgi:hypothetical protein
VTTVGVMRWLWLRRTAETVFASPRTRASSPSSRRW